MLIKLANATVYDPMHQEDGVVRNIFIRDGRIVAAPDRDERIDVEHDLRGRVVMAGAIDIHTHIGGGKMNIGRILHSEDHLKKTPKTALKRSGSGVSIPSTFATGYRYAEMGYTACFEPAMLPANARQAHMEMADTPMVDKGAYAMLGSDDYLLGLLSRQADKAVIRDYVAWTMQHSQAMALKVVNPGGINAFKFNQRRLDLDEANVHYGVTPRQVLHALASSLHELGVPHPLHVHGCNLGVPGNLQTTLDTMTGMHGLPIHMTHIQFHSYGTEGDKKFSSGAAQIAETVNSHPNVSIDVGQILFGQTITTSGDSMRQYAGSAHASPKKWVLMDIECDAGCGVVPFKYRDQSFVNALQWSIGLEIFLQVHDPWRIFLTTDHPNGAPFTSYPHLIRLLMDRSFRNDIFQRLHPDAVKASHLGSLNREYSLYEIAIMTRAAPARSLGLTDCGHLGVGARADITVYRADDNPEVMFAQPELVFKDGRVIVKEGQVVEVVFGATHVVKPEYDHSIEKDLREHYERFRTYSVDSAKLADAEIEDYGRGRLNIQPCRKH